MPEITENLPAKLPSARDLIVERQRILAEGINLDVAPRDFGWEKDETPPWWQLADESDMWYNRFERFFLMAGPARSLQSAYRMWVISEGGVLGRKAMKDVLNTWNNICREFSWRERASAYDGEINRLILKKVEASRRRLQDAAPYAVEALITALGDPKFRVQAAKEILDRAGLPATTRQEIRAAVGFTSEDLSDAEKEVREWEEQILNPSG